MAAFAHLMGVKTIDFSAPDDPTHHAVVERRNQMMEKSLDVAISRGDIKSAADLELYCSAAAATCNLELLYKGRTVLEYLTAEVPRTHRDVAATIHPGQPPAPVSSSFIKVLKSVLNDTNDALRFHRDDNARYDAMARDVNQQRGRSTQFTLHIGDQVSYDGEVYNLLSFSDPSPTERTKVEIRKVSHDNAKLLTVKYRDLRPLTTQRPEQMRSQPPAQTAVPASNGDFVFFTCSDTGSVLSGVVTASDNNTVTVHEYRQAPKMQRRFTPLYTNTQNRRLEAKLKPQTCHVPVMHTVQRRTLELSGSISNYQIDSHMFDTLRSRGVVDQCIAGN